MNNFLVEAIIDFPSEFLDETDPKYHYFIDINKIDGITVTEEYLQLMKDIDYLNGLENNVCYFEIMAIINRYNLQNKTYSTLDSIKMNLLLDISKTMNPINNITINKEVTINDFKKANLDNNHNFITQIISTMCGPTDEESNKELPFDVIIYNWMNNLLNFKIWIKDHIRKKSSLSLNKRRELYINMIVSCYTFTNKNCDTNQIKKFIEKSFNDYEDIIIVL